jgi:hypothetical protein
MILTVRPFGGGRGRVIFLLLILCDVQMCIKMMTTQTSPVPGVVVRLYTLLKLQLPRFKPHQSQKRPAAMRRHAQLPAGRRSCRSNLSSWSQVVNGFSHNVSMHCEAAPLAAITFPLPPLSHIAPGQPNCDRRSGAPRSTKVATTAKLRMA